MRAAVTGALLLLSMCLALRGAERPPAALTLDGSAVGDWAEYTFTSKNKQGTLTTQRMRLEIAEIQNGTVTVRMSALNAAGEADSVITTQHPLNANYGPLAHKKLGGSEQFSTGEQELAVAGKIIRCQWVKVLSPGGATTAVTQYIAPKIPFAGIVKIESVLNDETESTQMLTAYGRK